MSVSIIIAGFTWGQASSQKVCNENQRKNDAHVKVFLMEGRY